MAILDHPTSADLLLWQSGELSSGRTEEFRRHIAACAECRAKIAELESLYEGVSAADDRAAQYRIREALQERRRPFWRKLRLNPRWTAITATVVIAALLIVTISESTPSARAEVLLSKAVKEESAETPRPHLLRIQSSSVECNVAIRDTIAAVSVPSSTQTFCGRLSTNLRSAGWNWNDLLSARSFESWRDALKEKRDAIRKLPDASEVTTTTSEGPLRRATLRLRSTDYRPVQARFVFASSTGGEEPEIEVTESEDIPHEVTVAVPASRPETPRPELPKPLPAPDPLDTAEANVRLTLHRVGADKNILLAVNREPDVVKVTGIVPSEAQASSIDTSLAGLPNVETSIAAEGEGEEIPVWQSFHGDAPPLAYDQVNALYPNDPQGRQKFVNGLDMITLRLVGEAKTRDGLLSLAGRLLSSGKAAQLDSAAADVQSSMNADLASLASQLQPLIGDTTPQTARLTYPRAMQLYTLVHELVSLNKSDNPLGLDESLARTKKLISGK